MKILGFSVVVVAALSGALIGCRAGLEDADETAGEALRQSVLVGAFRLAGAEHDAPFRSLTLNDDHTFRASGGTSLSGRWKAKRVGPEGGSAVLELTDSSGTSTPYFYSLRSDQLALKRSPAGTPSLYDKDVSGLPKLRTYDVCADRYD